MYVYIDEIPDFENYDLVNIDEELHKKLFNLPPERLQFGTSSLYIVGTNKIDIKQKKIFYDYLRKDFLKLGKNLFNIAKQNNKIRFEPIDKINNKEFESYYLEHVLFEIELTKKQSQIMSEIYKNYDNVIYTLSTNKKTQNIYSYIYIMDDIINSLYLLHDKLNFKIDDYLMMLLNILKKLNKNLKLNIHIANILTEIKELSDTIENIKNEYKFDLKKEISLALKEPTKLNVNKYFEAPPLSITFNYSQYPEIKKHILKWVNEYGFPYYVLSKEEDKYKNKITKFINLKNNEYAVPCEELILCSVFSYMFYTIRTDWKKADEKIKGLFGFNLNNNTRNNSKKITNIKKLFSYYNTYVITNQLGLYSGYDNISISNYKEKDAKKKYEDCDNYFKYTNDYSQEYQENIFYNICLANYYLINDSVNMKDNNLKLLRKNKQKQCKICGKWFIPNKEFKNFCCSECKHKHEKEKDRIKKKNKRNKSGELPS